MPATKNPEVFGDLVIEIQVFKALNDSNVEIGIGDPRLGPRKVRGGQFTTHLMTAHLVR